MANFRYRAYSAQGELAEGELEARTAAEAEAGLWARGLVAFETRKLERAGEGDWWRREIFATGGLKLAELAAFTREFATLEMAEIPLDDALRMLGGPSASAAVRRLATDMLADVLDGATLSEAAGRRPLVFSSEYTGIVRAGETAGGLGRVLGELAEMLERRLELRGRMRSALTYPLVLFAMALVSAAIVAGFLVPGIAPIFADSGKPMPAGLRAIIAIEDNWVAVAAGIAGTAALATFAVRAALARPAMRLAFDRFKLRLPAAGALLAKIEMARFARTAGTLLRAGVPLLQSLAAARDVLANAVYAQGVARAIEAVRNGESLARALSAVPEVPAVLVQMVRIGEESRRTDHMLLRLAAMFETQSQRQIDQATALLTPALTIAIAALVGGLILTVMNAILSINDLVGQ